MDTRNWMNGRNPLILNGLLVIALGLAGCGVDGVQPQLPQADWIDELNALAGIDDLGENLMLDGRVVAMNPELNPGQVQAGDQDEKLIQFDKSVAPPRSTIKLKLTANKNNVTPNTKVTFTVKITSAVGGTAPYYAYWWLEGDKNWSRGGGNYTRTLTKSPKQSIYVIVIDSKRKESDIYSVDINVPRPTIERVCPTIAGEWSLSDSIQPLVLTVSGGTVTGTYKNGCGKILSGRFVTPESNCPDCVVVEARWDETDVRVVGGIPQCNVRADQAQWKGVVRFTFNPELSTFTARWSFDGESHWQGSLWSGSRWSCH